MCWKIFNVTLIFMLSGFQQLTLDVMSHLTMLKPNSLRRHSWRLSSRTSFLKWEANRLERLTKLQMTLSLQPGWRTGKGLVYNVQSKRNAPKSHIQPAGWISTQITAELSSWGERKRGCCSFFGSSEQTSFLWKGRFLSTLWFNGLSRAAKFEKPFVNRESLFLGESCEVAGCACDLQNLK